MRRITVDGVHYIDGIPVKESVFGQDPFEPVMYDRVDELLRATGYRGGVIGVSKQKESFRQLRNGKLRHQKKEGRRRQKQQNSNYFSMTLRRMRI